MDLHITIKKFHLYVIGLMLAVFLGALFVAAYNSGASPDVFGHSLEEIGLNVTCSASQKLTSNGTNVTCATDLQGITSESDPEVDTFSGTNTICYRDSSNNRIDCAQDGLTLTSGGIAGIDMGSVSGGGNYPGQLRIGISGSSVGIQMNGYGNTGVGNQIISNNNGNFNIQGSGSGNLYLAPGSSGTLKLSGSQKVELYDNDVATSGILCWINGNGGIGRCTGGTFPTCTCTGT